ncbi:MAG: hypothetical protein K2G28_01785, partial [Acetatifactor sp.]|nr:hypothetical protein [Acetatifactor sp.]
NYTFTDGTEANVIQVTREGSGVMGIYTSDALDTLNFPEEWMDWRQDEWQGKPWEEDWGQNTWPEDDFEAGSNPVSPSQIEQHYESGNLLMFQIEFSRLNEDAQIEWLNRIYTDGNIAYMEAAVTLLDEDCTAILNLAEAIYTDGNIAFFSSLAMHMSEDTLETWLERALADENWVFQSVLFNALDKSDEFKEMQEKREKKWAEAQTAEYQAAGVMVDGKNYYYQGQLVNIFLDIRSNKSFYTLNVNPAGTINIKIVRNENNEITGVDYMTETEVTELFGDMDEPDDIDVENPG